MNKKDKRWITTKYCMKYHTTVNVFFLHI